jgi:hypothetical protein
VRPEDALAAARERAAAAAAGAGPAEGFAELAIDAPDGSSFESLMEWAAIEPDLATMRSTRRGGAPITFLKRLLLRGLRQYHAELIAQQTRFNLNLLVHLAELEDRVRRLEDTRPPE